MRKRIAFAIVTVLVIAALCAAVFLAVGDPEKRTLRYFDTHREALEQDVQSASETGRASTGLKITQNLWDGEHPILEYTVINGGIVTSSKYYGFFYSFDGEPAAFQNVDVPLVQTSPQEWTWSADGDNRGLVRRLDGNWFYFEANL